MPWEAGQHRYFARIKSIAGNLEFRGDWAEGGIVAASSQLSFARSRAPILLEIATGPRSVCAESGRGHFVARTRGNDVTSFVFR